MRSKKEEYPRGGSFKKQYSFFANHPLIPNISIYNALRLTSWLFRFRKEYAFDCDGLTPSYQDLLDQADTMARAYKAMGVEKGDIIAVSLPNIYQAVVAFLGANRIGAVVTNLNYEMTTEELVDYLNEFESPVLINERKDDDYNAQLIEKTKLKRVVSLQEEDIHRNGFGQKEFDGARALKLLDKNILSYQDIPGLAMTYTKRVPRFFSGKRECLILFTSGSTGKSKSVVLTNQNIIASGIYSINTTGEKFRRGAKTMVVVPFSYPYSFCTGTILSILAGRQLILCPRLSEETVDEYLAKGPGMIFGTPAFLAMAQRFTKEDTDLSPIKIFFSGGDFLPPESYLQGKKFFQAHGSDCEIYNGSGNAEAAGVTTVGLGAEVQPDTCGRVLAGQDALILNPDTLKEQPYGEPGLFCVSGKNVFKGYYKNPELTRKAKFTYKGKEYLNSGALGILNEDGYLTIKARHSRFFIRADNNKVYCEHIQQFLDSIPGIIHSAVVPKPDDHWLFTPKAYIVMKEDCKDFSLDEKIHYIFQKCRETITSKYNSEKLRLKSFEIPSSISILDSLPKTVADKVNFKFLEDLARREYREGKLASQS